MLKIDNLRTLSFSSLNYNTHSSFDDRNLTLPEGWGGGCRRDKYQLNVWKVDWKKLSDVKHRFVRKLNLEVLGSIYWETWISETTAV